MHELRPVLGIHPQVLFSGPVDVVVTGPLAEEVLAVLREALTNVQARPGLTSRDNGGSR